MGDLEAPPLPDEDNLEETEGEPSEEADREIELEPPPTRRDKESP